MQTISLRKRPTFGDATPGFPAKWRLRNERRNSILMTRHYPDLGSASDWSCRVGNSIPPIRSNTQICVVTRHQYGIPCSFLRRHLVGKPVVALPNVRCFLRLGDSNVGRSLWKMLSKSILAGATLRVFHLRRRKCCLCNDICKRLDFLVFSDMGEKP